MRKMRGIRIIHEDPDLIVIEKSAGILSCPTRRGDEYTVEGALGQWVRKGQAKSKKRVYLVQRLDRETSGVMMVAKTSEVEEYFRSRWNEITEKTYLARVEGEMPEPAGVFESALVEDPQTLKVHSTTAPGGKPARTEWRVVSTSSSSVRPTSLVEVKLHTGRKNQIRVHFSEAGHPVVGDSRYGHGGGSRLCLHALKLSFVHPHSRQRVVFATEPPDFAKC